MKKNGTFKAAAYLRISVEDGDKVESNSIANQRDIVRAFVSKTPDIELVSEKVDDGFSGVNFDRPAFKELIEEVNAGTINCIIVKDLSRFGRDYIESGRYIEQLFPLLGIRFIAINDNVDTLKKLDDAESMLLIFKNMLNDFYCRDISNKIKSSIKARQLRGDYVGSEPVYGYVRSSENREKIVIDEEAAEVIKQIYSMRIDGHNNHYIADYLNKHGIASPMEHKKNNNVKCGTSFKTAACAKWSHASVGRVLQDETYKGVLLQGKEKRISYKIKKSVKQKKEMMIRIENHHEAIIPEPIFDLVQNLMRRDTRTPPKKEKVYLFSGLLECERCSHVMKRMTRNIGGETYVYYVCSNHVKNAENCNQQSYMKEKDIENAVLVALQNHIKILSSLSELLEEIDKVPLQEADLRAKDKHLKKKQEEYSKYKNLRVALYEDYREGVLSREDYLELGRNYDELCKETENSISVIETEIAKMISERHKYKGWIDEFIRNGGNINELTRSTLVMLVDHITICESRIKVFFRFEDEFRNMVRILEAASEQNRRLKLLSRETEKNIDHFVASVGMVV